MTKKPPTKHAKACTCAVCQGDVGMHFDDRALNPPPQDPTLRVRCYYDPRLSVPNLGATYFHCGQCLEEWKDMDIGTKQTPAEYARQQIAITADGSFQVWCTRHDKNIALIRMRAEYGAPRG